MVPAYNEELVIEALANRLVSVLDAQGYTWNVVFVDDGSVDGTLDKIRQIHEADSRFAAISLSRNFGKEVAIAAGLRHARGRAVIVMDADLQHPVELIPTFVARWREGYRVVLGARQGGSSGSFLRRLYSQLFHAVFRRVARTKLPVGAVDFLLLDRKAVDAINTIGERTRFSKGLYSWIGFPVTFVTFEAAERHDGTSQWNFFKLLQLALDGLISFSTLPIKIWSYIGALISLGALTYAIYFAVRTLFFDTDLPGFPSLIVSIMFFAGVQLMSLGILGEYIARIYEEVKARPLFIIAEEIGMGAPATQPEPRRVPMA